MDSIISKYYDKSSLLTLSNQNYKNLLDILINLWISSDNPFEDITSTLLKLPKKNVKATIYAKSNGIISGIEEITYITSKYNITLTPLTEDGTIVSPSQPIVELNGNINTILSIERLILNLMQRMSGISTETYNLISKVSQVNPSVKIAATRKTILGLIDKKAVSKGGGLTHRLSLKDAILIKENHISAYKTVTNTLSALLNSYSIPNKPLPDIAEIEVESLQQFEEVVDFYKRNRYLPFNIIVMLDNFSPQDIKEARKITPLEITLEASGGINPKNIEEYAKAGPDIISVGYITHSPKALDLSLIVK